MQNITLSAQDINNLADGLLRNNPIYKDFRNEELNTRQTIVTVKENADYALIVKKDGQTTSIKHYQNVISALCNVERKEY